MASSRGLPCRKERLREVTHLMGQHERVDVHHLECLIPRNELMIFGDAGSCLRAAGVDTRVAWALIAAGSYNDPLIYLIWQRGLAPFVFRAPQDSQRPTQRGAPDGGADDLR